MSDIPSDPTSSKLTDIKNPELWEFPMDYPISIIGTCHDDLEDEVLTILATHVPDFDLATLDKRLSKTGKYHAFKATLPLTHHKQVNDLYAALAAATHIKTVI